MEKTLKAAILGAGGARVRLRKADAAARNRI